jgi:hypothetical protein
LLVPSSARARVLALTRELGISAQGVALAPPALVLRAPRVGVYQSWMPAMDEGWTRFVFEQQMGVDYQTLHDRDVQAGGLRDRFDAIVLPSQSPDAMVTGHPPGSLPEEYTGGLGAKGVQELKAFAEAGGTLIALDAAARLAVRELGLGVRDALAVERPAGGSAAARRAASDFYCPGALLRVTTTPHPLTAGLDESAAIWFEESPAFDVEAGTAKVLARYPDENPLLSGWLLGERKLFGKGALVEAPLGRGRVVLSGSACARSIVSRRPSRRLAASMAVRPACPARMAANASAELSSATDSASSSTTGRRPLPRSSTAARR